MKNTNQSIFANKPVKIQKQRLKLFTLHKKMKEIFTVFLRDRRLERGVLYEMKRTCGKKGCSCAKSDHRHVSWYLTRSENGKKCMYYLKHDEVDFLRSLTREYSKFHKSKLELRTIFKDIIAVIDNIEKLKTKKSSKGGYVKKTKV
jgi:hypothetical protein